MKPQLAVSVPYIHFIKPGDLTEYLNDMRRQMGNVKSMVKEITGSMTKDLVKDRLVIFWVRRRTREYVVYTNIYNRVRHNG